MTVSVFAPERTGTAQLRCVALTDDFGSACRAPPTFDVFDMRIVACQAVRRFDAFASAAGCRLSAGVAARQQAWVARFPDGTRVRLPWPAGRPLHRPFARAGGLPRRRAPRERRQPR